MRLLEESELRWVSGGRFSDLDEPYPPGGQPPRDPDEPEPRRRQEEERLRELVDTLPEKICDSGTVGEYRLRIVEPEKEGAVGKLGPVSGIEGSQGESVTEIEVKCNTSEKDDDDDD